MGAFNKPRKATFMLDCFFSRSRGLGSSPSGGTLGGFLGQDTELSPCLSKTELLGKPDQTMVYVCVPVGEGRGEGMGEGSDKETSHPRVGEMTGLLVVSYMGFLKNHRRYASGSHA